MEDKRDKLVIAGVLAAFTIIFFFLGFKGTDAYREIRKGTFFFGTDWDDINIENFGIHLLLEYDLRLDAGELLKIISLAKKNDISPAGLEQIIKSDVMIKYNSGKDEQTQKIMSLMKKKVNEIYYSWFYLAGVISFIVLLFYAKKNTPNTYQKVKLSLTKKTRQGVREEKTEERKDEIDDYGHEITIKKLELEKEKIEAQIQALKTPQKPGDKFQKLRNQEDDKARERVIKIFGQFRTRVAIDEEYQHRRDTIMRGRPLTELSKEELAALEDLDDAKQFAIDKL